MKATYEVDDRVQVKASAGDRWLDGIVEGVVKGVVCVNVDGEPWEVHPARTWPKCQHSNKPAPKARMMRPPPPPPKENSREVIEGVARALGWQPPQPPRSEFRPDPKPPTPGRSLEYLAHVRTAACISPSCGEINDITAHHEGPRGTKAMGAKVSDYWCVPLCGHCHRFFHDHGTLGGCTHDETDRIFMRAHHALLTAWLDKMPVDEQRALLVAAFDRIG